jgi:RND family efflux transporter MFP subunit
VGRATGFRRPHELKRASILQWLLVVALTAAGLAVLSLPAEAAPAATPKPAVCLIEPDSVADVGSQVVGLVERVHVERGDFVRAGQPLVSLRSDVERANAGVADIRARIDAEVRAAAASLDLATQKLKRAEALVQQDFVSPQALEQARSERELALQKLHQARGQQQIYQQERRVADAQLGLRSLKSPLNGVVVERFVNSGERVEERALLRVAVIDPLRVELMVPTAQWGSIAPGGQITIRPELPGQGPLQATVRQVDKVMDPASNTFRVRLALANPGHKLPAGLRCKADLPGSAQAVAPAPPSAATPPAAPAPVQPGSATRPAAASPAPTTRLRLALALD